MNHLDYDPYSEEVEDLGDPTVFQLVVLAVGILFIVGFVLLRNRVLDIVESTKWSR